MQRKFALKINSWTGGMAHAVECLPSKLKAPSSNVSTNHALVDHACSSSYLEDWDWEAIQGK
jgi:hypothetical protein